MDMSDGQASGRWVDLIRPDFAAATATLCLGVALFAFNEFLVTTSMPTAVGELGGVALISWALTLYLVAAIVGGAAAAVLKARFGPRRALIAAAVIFLGGTVAAAAAGSMPGVLAGRVLQGFGEGIIAGVCYALIPELFPSRLVPKVFGAEAVVWAVAASGGPLLSGFVTETVSWRAAFLINLPLIAIFIWLVGRVVPPGEGRAGGALPPFGRLAAIAVGILSISVAGLAADVAVRAALLVIAAAVLAGTVVLDRRSRDRLFPVDAFSPNSAVGLGLWTVLLMPVAQCATSVYLVLTLQRLWGYGPTAAGAIGAAMALSWSSFAVLVANLRDRRYHKAMIGIGPGLLAAGLAGVGAGFWAGIPAAVLAGQIAIGAGFGIAWGFLSQHVMEAAPESERDRASALVPTVQSAGYAIGAAVAGLVANAAGYPTAAGAEQLVTSAVWVFGAAAAIALLSLATAIRLVRPRLR